MTQITETTNDGLKRELQIVVAKQDIGSKFDAKLEELKGQAQIKGFRKGKVPISHLKKLYGQSVMAEVLQTALEESSAEAIKERDERPAQQPKIDLPEDDEQIKEVMAGNADLSYKMSYEVIPKIEIMDFSKLELERLVPDVGDEAVEKALDELANRAKTYEPDEARAAEIDDRLKIDFVGKLEGEPFEGGAGDAVHLVLGTGNFIPGFEEALIGAKAGDDRVVKVTFPEDYHAKELAGKDAEFDVKVLEVGKPVKPAIDEELAKSLGAESLEKLRELVTNQISDEYAQVSRNKLKRDLLDALEKEHDFELPPALVESEFEAIWKQVTEGMEKDDKTFEDEGKTEDSAREEYKRIAERRVRLGLLIGEIGEKNEIAATKEELQRAVMEQARRYPGQEKFVFEYFEKTPGALDELRAPIFEDKVVDFALELAQVGEKKVSIEELLKTMNVDEDDESDAA